MSASLAGVMDVEVPDTLITNTAREKYAQMMAEFRGSGMDDDQIKKLITPENFLKYKDIEKADIEKDFKTSMATDEIARLENIEVPSYQVEEQLEAVRKEADGEDLGDEGQLRSKIESTLMRRLVFDFLADNAELEVEYVEEEEFDEKMLEELAEQTMQRYKLAEESADAAVQREKDFVDLRRKACESVAKLCQKSELSFNRLFVEALQFTNGVQGAMNVYKICTEISEQQHPGRQSIPDGLCKTSSEYLTWLRGEANNILSGETSQFKSLLDYIANECGGCATLAPIKGYKRTLQKVQDKYTGDFSKVLDVSRGISLLLLCSCHVNVIRTNTYTC